MGGKAVEGVALKECTGHSEWDYTIPVVSSIAQYAGTYSISKGGGLQTSV